MWFHLLLTLALAGFGLCLSPRADDCKSVGFGCSLDCSAVIYCAAVGGSAIPIQTCTGTGLLCGFNATAPNQYSCSATSCSPSGPSAPFICSEGNGITFPDPYNVSVSYICLTAGQSPAIECQCPNGQCYSTIPGCTINNGGDCGRLVPPCTTPGEMGKYKSDPGYYYICDANGIAHVGKCPGDQVFDPNTGGGTCVDTRYFQDTTKPPSPTNIDLGKCSSYVPPGSTTSTTTETPTDTPTPTPTDTTTSSSTSSSTSAPFTCRYAGEQFPGPNCTSYYKCNSALKPILINCVYVNTHYEPPPIGGCVPGPCTRQDYEFYQYIQEPTFEDEDYESQPSRYAEEGYLQNLDEDQHRGMPYFR